MATISLNTSVVTVINTFTVEPQQQQRALELLIEIARRLRQAVPGFLSANFHRSLDGTRVVNYAQYANQEAVDVVRVKLLEEMADEPIVVELRSLATPDFCAYEVSTILEG